MNGRAGILTHGDNHGEHDYDRYGIFVIEAIDEQVVIVGAWPLRRDQALHNIHKLHFVCLRSAL